MKKTLNLYNHFHNGDVFYSRIMIQSLITKFNINYYHNLKTPLLSDIDGLTEFGNIPQSFIIERSNFDNDEVNTWIGQDNHIYLNSVNNGCSYENYFALVKKTCERYGIDTPEYDILPSVDFQKLYNYEKIKTDLENYKKNYKKIILISNGDVHSGQAHNIDLTPLINSLSEKNPSCLFLITQNIRVVNKNIINTFDITQTIPDLNQISFISTFADIIIGRASGPYCFAHLEQNLLDENKIFISISNNRNEGVWYSKSKAEQIWTNNYDLNNLYNIINQKINK